MSWTPEKSARLAELQGLERAGGLLDHEPGELDALRRELAQYPEVADDKSTPFVNESRRPQLDGTDWNEHNNAMCRDEVAALGVKYGLPLLKLAVESLLRK